MADPHEPLPYFQGNRARRVNILETAYTYRYARIGPYLRVSSRYLPYLPREIRELIVGYAGPPVAPRQRVGGISQRELWGFNRGTALRTFLAPVHLIRREAHRLRAILRQPFTVWWSIWNRDRIRGALRRLNALLNRTRELIAKATSGYHPHFYWVVWGTYWRSLMAQREQLTRQLGRQYRLVELATNERTRDEPRVRYVAATGRYWPRLRGPGF